MTNRKKVIKIAATVVCLIGVGVALFFLYNTFAEKPVEGSKNITLHVITADGAREEFKISTDAEFLAEALLDEKLVEGEDGQYGLFIKKVNGIAANEAAEEWWCLTKGGETLTTGISMTPIHDGDVFELTLTVGWDNF